MSPKERNKLSGANPSHNPPSYVYEGQWTRAGLEELLDSILERTLGEIDAAHVFDKTKTHPKITGIAGDVIEQSVLGYPANSEQKPDIVVDSVPTELKTTGLRVNKGGNALEVKEPMSITAVSLDTIAGEEFGSSNFKHIIEVDGRYRRLVPDELDQLQGFPRGWRNTGMSDGHRAFCMGNALVVGVPHRIGVELARRL